MPSQHNYGRVDLNELYRRLQRELSARLSVASLIEHASTAGAKAESHWIDFLNLYLPPRYRASRNTVHLTILIRFAKSVLRVGRRLRGRRG